MSSNETNDAGRLPSHSVTSDDAAEDSPLPHLSDQVAASAFRYRQMEGSALWVLLAMYRAFAVLDRDQAVEVSTLGLTPLQFNILNVLQRVGKPITMGTLASALVVQPTNLSSNFSALADKGLVKRELNDKDRRSLLAVLTKKGDAFLEKVLPPHWERLELLMSALSKEDRISLVALLKRMSTSIDSHRSDAADFLAAVAPKKPPRKKKESAV
jgi:DNA-binding MarR family transcriptional regulator